MVVGQGFVRVSLRQLEPRGAARVVACTALGLVLELEEQLGWLPVQR